MCKKIFTYKKDDEVVEEDLMIDSPKNDHENGGKVSPVEKVKHVQNVESVRKNSVTHSPCDSNFATMMQLSEKIFE